MRGHLKEQSPGHWAIILDIHDPQTGKRRRKWHSFKGTKKEARIECSRLIMLSPEDRAAEIIQGVFTSAGVGE